MVVVSLNILFSGFYVVMFTPPPPPKKKELIVEACSCTTHSHRRRPLTNDRVALDEACHASLRGYIPSGSRQSGGLGGLGGSTRTSPQTP